jgi:hypothetical protein
MAAGAHPLRRWPLSSARMARAASAGGGGNLISSRPKLSASGAGDSGWGHQLAQTASRVDSNGGVGDGRRARVSPTRTAHTAAAGTSAGGDGAGMGRNGAAGVSAGGDGAATVSAGGEKAAAVSAGGEKAAAVSEGGEKVAGVSSPSLSPQRMNTAAQKADVQSGVEPVTASCASTVLACPLPF